MRHSISRTVVTLCIALGTTALAIPPTALAAAPESQTLVKPNRFGLPDFGDLVAEVSPAVVNISVVHTQTAASSGSHPFADDPMFDLLRRFGIPMPNFPGQPQGPQQRGPQISRGIGSGFIISADGYVLTNAHVVSERGTDTEVTVRLLDRREFKAKVIGTDPRTDIAVLKIDATGLPTVKLGDPEQARVGEWVVAVGSPFGFDSTVTAGIISAKARRLPSETYVPFIQTDVAINPGNSGGPLFNLAGEVIGINAQIYSRSGGFMGISFAIPIDVALNVKDQLVEFGRVQRGRLGVLIQPVDKELAQNFGLSEPYGALVSRVEPDSAAAKAGLQPGDIITGVGGMRVEESTDLPRIIGEKRPGTKVQLDVWRERANRRITATLDEMPADDAPPAAPKTAPEPDDSVGALGLRGRNIDPAEAGRLGIPGGVLVEGVSGAAAKAGLREGDIVLALNNQGVANLAELRARVEASGKRFALLVQRGDGRIFLPVVLD
ncbi:MAG: DegQ family serine endoprotease [Pseudazoarcus pumilus]|nr:DegQ family serine endoprotease [Pseudazoarcus pumilus]